MQSGATFSGTGTLGGALPVQSGGTLAPGVNGTGTLTINNTLSLAGTAAMQIGRTGSALSADKVSGLTTLTYGGTLLVTNTCTEALVAGDAFQLFSATTRAGSFSTITLPTLPSGLIWETSGLAESGTIAVRLEDAGIVANPYAAWASAHGLEGSSIDPDHDGTGNLLEFSLDGDPQASDGFILPVATVTPTHFKDKTRVTGRDPPKGRGASRRIPKSP